MTIVMVVLGSLWALAMIIAVLSFWSLETNERSELKRNFAHPIRNRIFLGYPGIIIDVAKQLADDLSSKGYSIFYYNPHRPFPDPVDSVATAIEEAEYVVILQPRETDWLHAEEKYSKLIGRPIVRVFPSANRSVRLSKSRLIISKILRPRHQTTNRRQALEEGFDWGEVKHDHNRSASPGWEKGIDGWEFDQAENARKGAGCLLPFLSLSFLFAALAGLILLLLGTPHFVLITAGFAVIVMAFAGVGIMGDIVMVCFFSLGTIAMILRR